MKFRWSPYGRDDTCRHFGILLFIQAQIKKNEERNKIEYPMGNESDL